MERHQLVATIIRNDYHSSGRMGSRRKQCMGRGRERNDPEVERYNMVHTTLQHDEPFHKRVGDQRKQCMGRWNRRNHFQMEWYDMDCPGVWDCSVFGWSVGQ